VATYYAASIVNQIKNQQLLMNQESKELHMLAPSFEGHIVRKISYFC